MTLLTLLNARTLAAYTEAGSGARKRYTTLPPGMREPSPTRLLCAISIVA
jgi:hypothetical protein